MKNKIKLGVCGAFPGPIGGTTILVQQHYEAFLHSEDFEVSKYDFLSHDFLKSFPKIRPFYLCFKSVLQNDVSTINVSLRGFRYLLLFICILKLVFNNKVIIFRYYGGDATSLYGKLLYRMTWLLVKYSKFQGPILTETLSNIAYFDQLGLRTYQLTNSRPEPREQINKTTNDVMKCIFIGQMKKSKGVLDIIRAVDENMQIQIDLYGPLEWDISLSELQSSPKVRYCGIIPLGRAPTIIREYDCMIFPTRWPGESHAGVVIEAYSVGVPVIAYEWQALSEIISDGQTGYLIPPADIPKLSRKLKALSENPEQLTDLSLEARKRFVNYFTDQISFERTRTIIMGEIYQDYGNDSVQKYMLNGLD